MSQEQVIGHRLASGALGSIEMFLLNEAKKLETENKHPNVNNSDRYRITCECIVSPKYLLQSTDDSAEHPLDWYDPLFVNKNLFVTTIKKTYRCYHGKEQLAITQKGHNAYKEYFSMTPRRYKAIHALISPTVKAWQSPSDKSTLWCRDIAEEEYWYNKFSLLPSKRLAKEEDVLHITETRAAYSSAFQHFLCAPYTYDQYIDETRAHPRRAVLMHTLFKDMI